MGDDTQRLVGEIGFELLVWINFDHGLTPNRKAALIERPSVSVVIRDIGVPIVPGPVCPHRPAP